MQSTVIPVTEKEQWNHYITCSEDYDFYHCHSYNSLKHDGVPFLFVSDDGSDFVAFPLLKREIENTAYFDCTSVWGYPGPVASNSIDRINPALLAFFKEELKQYMHGNCIVAAFSRLHPIIEQEAFLKDFGEIHYLNRTVAIDLSLPLALQRQQYQSCNKLQINQLRRKGYVVKQAATEEEINTFVDIYNETMRRVNATAFYFDYFDTDYFHNLLHLDDTRPFLLLALDDGKIVAGGIFVATKHLMQYHIAGTRNDYLKARPMKLIIDEARLLATQMALRYLHLGGGVNGSDSDSLFSFKASFSNTTFVYKTWRCIVQEEMYNNLVRRKTQEKALNSSYFPLYRA